MMVKLRCFAAGNVYFLFLVVGGFLLSFCGALWDISVVAWMGGYLAGAAVTLATCRQIFTKRAIDVRSRLS